MPHRFVPTAPRLNEVRYEIRGELFDRALALEGQGHHILKLNIGNPGSFGFEAPAHLRSALAENFTRAEAYAHQQGLPQAREAIAARERQRGASGAHADNVYIGNGVSELIDLALRALLDSGDEVLVPAPDYPLWTASVRLNDGRAVHYPCHAENGFVPDSAQIDALVTPRTRALVVINPNNPTGAVYPREVLQELAAIAERHRLVLMSDEIYDEILYDDATFVPMAALVHDTLCLSFGGLSKVHRACGWRVGWMSLSGTVQRALAYRCGLDLLATLRLCSNVPAQWAIVPALSGPATIAELCRPGGRLYDTRAEVLAACAASEFLSVVPPRGAMYAFPRVDADELPDFDDAAFALELLELEHVLITPGSGFNVPYRDHFRITLLPEAATMRDVFARVARVLERMAEAGARQRHVA